MYFLSIRRFLRWNVTRNTVTRHEKLPLNFKESISEAPRYRKRCINPWVFVFLIAPGLYYHLFNKSLTEENNSGKMNFVEAYPERSYDGDRLQRVIELNLSQSTKKKVIPLTNTPTMMHRIFNEKSDPYESTSTLPKLDINYYSSKLPKCSKSEKYEAVTLIPTLPKSENSYQDVKMGGYYQPKDCKAKHKVAIIVPYRDRETTLAIFIFNIHSFLIKQKLEYRIFVIEQYGNSKFNRGRLYNAGFKEMQKYGNWQCVVFHDVDLVPLDTRIKYSCPVFPRHMCGTIIEKKKIHENSLFGGVTQMSLAHYRLVNGYSNSFWGWGGEDHDMFWRLQYARLPVLRYNKSMSHYAHITHPQAISNPERYNILGQYLKKYKTEGKFRKEGLSTIVYEVISTKLRHLYTHIIVNINLPLNNSHK